MTPDEVRAAGNYVATLKDSDGDPLFAVVAGTQCASVRSVQGVVKGTRTFPAWRAALYEVRASVRTGKLTWRYIEEAGPRRWTERAAIADARASNVAPYIEGVRHGSAV